MCPYKISEGFSWFSIDPTTLFLLIIVDNPISLNFLSTNVEISLYLAGGFSEGICTNR